ncbi:MAG: DUF6268 family outer membrane beta-barrel protein [Desulfobacterales bacterium]
MIRKSRALTRLILYIAVIFLPAFAWAASPPCGPPAEAYPTTLYQLSYTPLYQFDTDLDSGGSFDVQRHLLRIGASRALNRSWTLGVGLSFDYEHWNFSGIDGLAGADLWDDIYRPGISLPLFYSTANRWRFGIIPSFDMAAASGADTGESLSYGAVLSAARSIRPGLMIGVGVGLFERLDQGEVFPYVVIDWKISDRLRLSNPFQAGPVGPAGLELSYRTADAWELGLGGAYRSYRFRLDDSSAVEEGIAEVDFWAPFARMGRKLGEQIWLDLNGGVLLNGNITIEDKDSDKLGDSDYDPTPFVGLTLRGRF